jgi:hypothetical protein
MKNLCISIALYFILCSTSLAQSRNEPYNFPVKPGSLEWKQLETQEEMTAACQIPSNLLETMSTNALVETCLHYPLFPQMTAYNNIVTGFDKVMLNFNGFTELLKRKDATTVLLRKYREMDPSSYGTNWSSVRKGQFIYEYLFIEMMIAQERFQFLPSYNDRKNILSECLKKYDLKLKNRELFGLNGIGHTAFVMVRTFNATNFMSYKTSSLNNSNMKTFETTGIPIEFETLSKIKDMAVEYVKTK